MIFIIHILRSLYILIFFIFIYFVYTRTVVLSYEEDAVVFKFTSEDGTSIDDGWSEAVVNKRSVWTLRRLQDEEETEKGCLSLYKRRAPERPTFRLPLPVRAFFRIVL